MRIAGARTVVTLDGVDVGVKSMSSYGDVGFVVMESDRHLLGDRHMKIEMPDGAILEGKVCGRYELDLGRQVYEHRYYYTENLVRRAPPA